MKKIISLIAVAVLLSVNAFAGGKGKIVFSKSPIDAATGENSPPVTFEVGDKIYCQVYLEKPLSEFKAMDRYKEEDLKDISNGYIVTVFIDNFQNWDKYSANDQAKNYQTNVLIDNTISDKKTFGFLLNTPNSKMKNNQDGEFNDALNKLSNGNHTIRIVVRSVSMASSENTFFERSKKPIATADFVMIKTANSKIKIGKSFKDIESKMTNSTLEAKIMKYLNDDKVTNAYTKERTYLKLKLVSDDYIIVRHESTGVIVGRTIDVAVLYKDANGNCQIDLNAFREDYTGSGYQEKPYYVRRAFLEQEHPDIKIGPADCE